MKYIIVGTAGHIDHGKSALVRALTGTDPDRLEEEKRRGITIDIGFATLDFGSDVRSRALPGNHQQPQPAIQHRRGGAVVVPINRTDRVVPHARVYSEL